jgi:PAS domain-containing protein
VVLVYILTAGIWTLCLDIGFVRLIDDPGMLIRWQALKNILFILTTASILFFYLKSLLRRQLEADAAFRTIQRGTAGKTGQDYFQFLTSNLPRLLGTRICFIGEWDKAADGLKIIAGSPDDFIDKFTAYPLQGTPCRQILANGRAMALSPAELQQYSFAGRLEISGPASYFGVPLFNPDGQPIGLLVSLSASKPKNAARTLRILETFAARASSELGRILSERRTLEQFKQFATLFDALNAVIYVADMETYELLYVNRFTEEAFGKDWRGEKCFAYLQNSAAQECGFCTNQSLLVDGQPGPAILWEFRNTSNNRWYQCLDKCIRWTDGRLVRVEIALDITARKEMEQTKEELLSAVSHEMRTPLTAITGFAELLLEEKNLPNHIRQHIRTIFNESEKMAELINTFLELRRLKSDQARVDYQPLTVKSLLQHGIGRVHECAEHHAIHINCPADLQVFGNRQELRQVFRKLLSNACRFSPQGGAINLEAWLEGDEVIIRIEDFGLGIPPEEHEQIFEHFHRLDRGNSRRTGGAGLGLSLVREAVTLHGGRVWVESRPGHGSRFFVALPCHASQQQAQGL